ncbi:hypothetical protein A9W99_18045 [Mycobacterium sp. 1164966.3]|uniref:DUF4235 domain-containing protein n=1 Tax=Mycobacterium sp. 1164966.3 TaxID=1856861 RepID=UPI0007FF7E57|nr:DUF4235 domain-containing protein [Mycobacterium sp. 1164966.3]OBA80014.1 hypothetical protein A9W99_18045 [Mycobacterium sp. 1164966.3]
MTRTSKEAAIAHQRPNKTAKMLYRPIGLTISALGGLLAGIIFKQVWRRAASGEPSEPPRALQTEYPLKQILFAAALEGAIYSVVKTAIDRQGARLFEKWTGEWPGE